jgi:hypothetical protein
MYCGKRGIITAACGYFGVLIFITSLGHGISLNALYLPIALLAVGYAVAKLMSDKGNLKLGK